MIESLMKKYQKKGFVPSSSEIVIKYISHNTHGEMIVDTNFFNLCHKRIMKALSDCEITSMIQRSKVCSEN